MATTITVITVLLTLAVSLPMVYAATISEVNALKANLTEGYNKFTMPAPSDEWVGVNISVVLEAIGDLDERLEKLTTILTVTSMWNDQSMIWDSNETDIGSLTMDRSEMWVPHIRIINQHYDISYGKEEEIYTPVVFDSDGYADYSQIITAETTCDLDMSSFPFDSHTCKIELYITESTGTILTNSTLYDFSGSLIHSDGTWDIKHATIDYSVVTIALVRKPLFILVNLILPMTLLALLSPLVFLLPNNSGERVGFSITVLLAISVFMTMVADQVPHKSQPLPRLLVLLIITYSLTVLVAVIVVINARIYRIPNKSRVPRALVRLHTLTRCCCYCFRRRNTSDNVDSVVLGDVVGEKAALTEKVPRQRTKTVTWKDVSWMIDMCAMVLIYLLKIAFAVIFYAGHV